MKLAFKKKTNYNERDLIDEVVRSRLFEDVESLDCADNPEEMFDAYEKVLRYISVNTDKRLKVFDKIK